MYIKYMYIYIHMYVNKTFFIYINCNLATLWYIRDRRILQRTFVVTTFKIFLRCSTADLAWVEEQARGLAIANKDAEILPESGDWSIAHAISPLRGHQKTAGRLVRQRDLAKGSRL